MSLQINVSIFRIGSPFITPHLISLHYLYGFNVRNVMIPLATVYHRCVNQSSLGKIPQIQQIINIITKTVLRTCHDIYINTPVSNIIINYYYSNEFYVHAIVVS